MTRAAATCAIAFLVACSSSPSATGGSGGEGPGASVSSGHASSASASTGASTGAGGAGGGASCMPPGAPSTKMSIDVGAISAVEHDLSEAPVANAITTVCGFNICLTGKSAADGSVIIAGGGKSLQNPAFEFGDGYRFGRFALPVTMSGDMNLGTVHTASLPMQGAAFTPGSTIESGGVKLTLAANATVTIEPTMYSMPDQQLFRAASMPKSALPLAPNPALDLVFVLGPANTTICPAAGVEIDNTAMWPAGTAVELWVHGIDISEDWAPYGGWSKVSDGAVSADGSKVQSNAGQGLPLLTILGVRKP